MLAVALAVAILVNPSPAQAHAFLLYSTPADGASLAAPPRTLTLAFDENILLPTARLTLLGPHGAVALQSVRGGLAEGASRQAGPDLEVTLPRLGNGAYSATWYVQSADDLHATSGTLSFAVGQADRLPGIHRRAPAPGLVSSALRSLDLTGFAALLGALLLLGVVLPRSQLAAGRTGSIRALLWRAVIGLAAAELLVGALALVDAVGPNHLGGVLSTGRFGQFWLLREAGLVLAIAVGLSARGAPHSARRQQGAAVAAGLVTLASLAGLAGDGHVGVGAGRPVAVALLTVHLAAAGCWAGALILLGALHILRNRAAAGAIRPLLRAFGRPAFACVSLAVSTGIALTGRQVASADALLRSGYGQLLMAKMILVGAALVLGGSTGRRLRGQALPSRRLRSRIFAESATLLLVLIAAGVLSLATPARGPLFAQPTPGSPGAVSAQVGDLLESVALSPNSVGSSFLHVEINQTRRPAPAPVTGVSAALNGPRGIQIAPRALARTDLANDWTLGDLVLAAPGDWQIVVTVIQPGRLPTVWQANWTVASATPGAQHGLLSNHPWLSGLDVLAAVVVLLAFAAQIVLIALARCRLSPPAQPDPSTPAQHPAMSSGAR